MNGDSGVNNVSNNNSEHLSTEVTKLSLSDSVPNNCQPEESSPSDPAAKFSIQATEFVPGNKFHGNHARITHTSQTPSSSYGAWSSGGDPSAGGGQRNVLEHQEFAIAGGRVVAPPSMDAILQFVYETLDELVKHPGGFEQSALKLFNFMAASVHDEMTLQTVIELIFETAVSMPNCAYICARLCSYLSENFRTPEGTNIFRQFLLQKCHSEHEVREIHFADVDQGAKRLRNFCLFLAELYLQLEAGGKKIAVLAPALLVLLKMFCSDTNNDNIKSAISVLKCCGAYLDALGECRAGMDDIFVQLAGLTCNPSLSQNVKEALTNLIRSRSNHWQATSSSNFKNSSSAPAPTTSNSNNHTNQHVNVPAQNLHPPSPGSLSRVSSVHYGPDGQPLTAEEEEFFYKNLIGSSESEEDTPGAMNDDEYEAYEQFLRMQNANK